MSVGWSEDTATEFRRIFIETGQRLATNDQIAEMLRLSNLRQKIGRAVCIDLSEVEAGWRNF
eukprot:scaffold27061_cov152-Skeletonema_menzelii.AAC.6